MRTLLILSLLASCASVARAEPTAAPVDIEKQTLERFGTANPTCREWSDGCAVCTRADDTSAACSLPGIACQPHEIGCTAPAPTTPTPSSPPK